MWTLSRIKMKQLQIKYFFFKKNLMSITFSSIFNYPNKCRLTHFKLRNVFEINETISWRWLWNCRLKVLRNLNNIWNLYFLYYYYLTTFKYVENFSKFILWSCDWIKVEYCNSFYNFIKKKFQLQKTSIIMPVSFMFLFKVRH